MKITYPEDLPASPHEEELLTAVLRAAAADIEPGPGDLRPIRTRATRRRRQTSALAGAAVAAAALGIVALIPTTATGPATLVPATAVRPPGAEPTPRPTPTGAQPSATPGPASPSAMPTTLPAPAPGPAGPAGPGAGGPRSAPALSAGLATGLPLFPFRTLAQANAWDPRGGSQPWHADPAATAQAFATALGLPDVTDVVAVTGDGRQSSVQLGYRTPTGRLAVAAEVHLARYGSQTNAPWEVVGTNDTTLTITAPAYGSPATAAMGVGGRITGVDENIRVSLRDRAGTQLATTSVPAGGDHSPWSGVLAGPRSGDSLLLIVAVTGGHLRAHERFAVTAVTAS